jgi:hypothetical protein
MTIVCGLMLIAACGPTKDQAITYNDAITDEHALVMDKFDALFASYDEYENPSAMDNAYTDAVNAVDAATKNFEAMKDFDGETAFRDEAIALMKVYKSLLDNEFKQMIVIYKLPEDQYTEEKKAEWQGLRDEAVRKMDEGLAKIKAEQEKFAAKYNFEIIATE